MVRILHTIAAVFDNFFFRKQFARYFARMLRTVLYSSVIGREIRVGSASKRRGRCEKSEKDFRRCLKRVSLFKASLECRVGGLLSTRQNQLRPAPLRRFPIVGSNGNAGLTISYSNP